MNNDEKEQDHRITSWGLMNNYEKKHNTHCSA